MPLQLSFQQYSIHEEIINVFLTPDLLQLQQYCIVAKHLFWSQVSLCVYTCAHCPGITLQVHLGVTLPSVGSFHHRCPPASCYPGPPDMNPFSLPPSGPSPSRALCQVYPHFHSSTPRSQEQWFRALAQVGQI